jgi:hypothetical protein
LIPKLDTTLYPAIFYRHLDQKKGGGMPLSALQEFARSTWAKVLCVLAVIAMLLGVATEAVVLYGQSQEAVIKAETAVNAGKRQAAEARIEQQKARIAQEAAANAQLLERAKAAKTTAEANAARAVADSAAIKQSADAKYATQIATIERVKATYAERIKRAEADKLQQEALTQKEIADNSDVKLRAEAQALDIEAKIAEAGALRQQWQNNCRQILMRKGRPIGNAAYDCSGEWFRFIAGLGTDGLLQR